MRANSARRLVSLVGRRPFLIECLVLLVASVPAIWPLLSPGYLHGEDHMDTPWRALELLESLKGGVLFPRWSPDLFYGFGFPIFNFYSPLSFYEVVAMRILGAADLLQASKFAFALNLLASGVGAYIFARSVGSKRAPAVAAGILYLYAPSTLRDVYVRSGLASLTGTALLPFLLAAFVRLLQAKTLTAISVAALLLTIMILTHNLTSVVALGMVVVFVLVYSLYHRDLGAVAPALVAVALGLGMAAFFMVPAMTETSLTHTEKLTSGNLDYRVHFVDPLGEINGAIESRAVDKEYSATRWGPVDLHPAYPYGLPPMKLSLLQTLLMVGAIAAFAARKRPSEWILSAAVAALGLFYLHLSWSRWLWEILPVLQSFQFPWRMLEPMGLCLAVLGAWVVQSMAGRFGTVASMVLSVMAVASGIWMLPTDLAPFEGGVQITRDNLIRHEFKERNRIGTMVDGQFLPLAVQWDEAALKMGDLLPRYDKYYPPDLWVGKTAFLQPEVKGSISAARSGQQWMDARVQADESLMVAFHTVYFPGWTAYVDGNQVPIKPTSWQTDDGGRSFALGICQVPVPPGSHLVRIQFEHTPLRFWSSVASLLSLLIVVVLLFWSIWKSHRFRPVKDFGYRQLSLRGFSKKWQDARHIG